MSKERLIVKNFGPIKEVDINLAKVTVFIGEQASGKSVLAKLATLLSNPVASESNGTRDLIIPMLKGYNINTFLCEQSYALFENEKFLFGFRDGGLNQFKKFKDENLDAVYGSIIEIINNKESELIDFLVKRPDAIQETGLLFIISMILP